jgi:hypothetical protein
MNILILHSARFEALAYDQAIAHERHTVVYIGLKEKLEQIPQGLRCTKIERAGSASLFDEVEAAVVRLGVPFDFLICATEYDMMDAARLRQRFNVTGPWPAQAEKVRNKLVMKRCVADAGMRIPMFETLEKWLAGEDLAIGQESAIILKPIDGASAVNVRRFDNQSQLRAALRERRTGVALLDDENGRVHHASFEVEEFVDGRVLFIDGIIKNGELQIFIVSRYLNTMLDFANGIPSGSIQLDSAVVPQDWIAKILAAVEIRQGAFHLEVIDNAGGMVFLEVAHRVGGGWTTESFKAKTGIHLSVADIKTITDPDYVVDPAWDTKNHYGDFMVPAHHLKKPYCRVSGYEYLLASDKLFVLNKLDVMKAVPGKVTYVETSLPLTGQLRGDSPEEVQAMLEELFGRIVVEGLDEWTESAMNERTHAHSGATSAENLSH